MMQGISCPTILKACFPPHETRSLYSQPWNLYFAELGNGAAPRRDCKAFMSAQRRAFWR